MNTKMKLTRKVLLILSVFAVLLFGGVLTASAAVRQDGVKDRAVTISWDDPNSGSSYTTTTAYHIQAGTDSNHLTIFRDLPATQRSITLTGLGAGAEYYIKVTNDERNSYGSTYTGEYVGVVYAQTLPAKPSGLKVSSYSPYMTSVDFAWNFQDISGYQWVLKNSTGAVVDSGETSYASTNPSVFSRKINAKSVFTFQVRGYSKAYNSNAKVYGPWSDSSYFVPQPQLKGKKYTKVVGGKLSVKWTKVKGASSYSVYVSTKSNKGFKKVKTVSAKKSSVKIKKFKGRSLEATSTIMFM